MKTIIRRLSVFGSILAVLVSVLSFASASAAGSASFSLSPNSGSYQVGSSFTVSLRENSGSDPVNVVEARLSYDASKLQFTGVSDEGTAFDSVIDNTGGGGNVHITRYKGGGGSLVGSQVVGAVSFKAISAGAANVSFVSGSHIVRSSDQQDIWNGSSSAATFTVTAAPSSGGGSSGGSSSGGSSSGAGSSAGSSTTQRSNSSSATTPNTTAAQSQNGATQNPADPNAQAATELTTGILSASAGEPTYLVAIRVLNHKGKPVAGKKVTIENQTVTTDSTGIASFSNAVAGKYKVSVKDLGSKVVSEIVVERRVDETQPQEFEIRLPNPVQPWMFAVLGGIIILTVILLIIKKKKGIKLFRRK